MPTPWQAQANAGYAAQNAATPIPVTPGQDPGSIIKAAQAAATPIPSGHSLDMPLSLQPNLKQWQDTPKDNRPVLGRKAANARGIENAMISVGNLIGEIKTEKDNKEKLKIATATQQVLKATRAKDEATQQLKEAQASGDQEAIKLAKEQVDYNTNIIKGVMSDDKTWKAMQKGFNINYTDPQSNNTLSHQAVQQGKKMAHTDDQLLGPMRLKNLFLLNTVQINKLLQNTTLWPLKPKLRRIMQKLLLQLKLEDNI